MLTTIKGLLLYQGCREDCDGTTCCMKWVLDGTGGWLPCATCYMKWVLDSTGSWFPCATRCMEPVLDRMGGWGPCGTWYMEGVLDCTGGWCTCATCCKEPVLDCTSVLLSWTFCSSVSSFPLTFRTLIRTHTACKQRSRFAANVQLQSMVSLISTNRNFPSCLTSNTFLWRLMSWILSRLTLTRFAIHSESRKFLLWLVLLRYLFRTFFLELFSEESSLELLRSLGSLIMLTCLFFTRWLKLWLM